MPLRPFLLLSLALGLSGCVQAPTPLPNYVAPTTGPTSRLLMRGSLEPGDSYGIYLMRGTDDCSQPQRVGFGNATNNPPVTTIPANQVSTVEVLVSKANKSLYRIRWSFLPKAGGSYLVAVRSAPNTASASVLDATDPDAIKLDPAARRRDVPGNGCVAYANAKSMGELMAQGKTDNATAKPAPAPAKAAAVPAPAEDDFKTLSGR